MRYQRVCVREVPVTVCKLYTACLQNYTMYLLTFLSINASYIDLLIVRLWWTVYDLSLLINALKKKSFYSEVVLEHQRTKTNSTAFGN